jgi:general secretion pathway protein G
MNEYSSVPPSAAVRKEKWWVVPLISVAVIAGVFVVVLLLRRNEPKAGQGRAGEAVAQETKAKANVLTLSGLLLQYSAKFKQPPSAAAGLRALILKGITDNETLFTDPWGQPVRYKVPGTRSRERFDVYSIGGDGIDGTEDDIGNWEAAE